MKATVELAYDRVVVKFGDTLPLSLKLSKLIGIQSWRLGPYNFFIEFTMDGGVITSEYDDEEKWKSVLSGVSELI